MIEPPYLAALRHQVRCELLLTMVQLEQLCPGWWADISEMAQQLGTDRASLNRSLTKLEAMGLIRRERISNTGGNWVWWVKRCEDDQPCPDAEPAWRLRDLQRGRVIRVTIRGRWQWAERQGIPRATMQSFLGGHQRTMKGRWQVAGSPWDDESGC
jgi:DNA-binding transcriptional ArsR family regulator